MFSIRFFFTSKKIKDQLYDKANKSLINKLDVLVDKANWLLYCMNEKQEPESYSFESWKKKIERDFLALGGEVTPEIEEKEWYNPNGRYYPNKAYSDNETYHKNLKKISSTSGKVSSRRTPSPAIITREIQLASSTGSVAFIGGKDNKVITDPVVEKIKKRIDKNAYQCIINITKEYDGYDYFDIKSFGKNWEDPPRKEKVVSDQFDRYNFMAKEEFYNHLRGVEVEDFTCAILTKDSKNSGKSKKHFR